MRSITRQNSPRRFAWGQQDSAIKCMNNGGNTPLGYYVDKATGKLEIDPETAPYVRELFSRYADGERLTVLQAEMAQRGLRSKRGNPYSISVLSNLLKNRKYIGEYKYGDVIIPDPDYRREIVDTFVNSVYVYDDRLLLTYNYKDGSQALTLKEMEAALLD